MTGPFVDLPAECFPFTLRAYDARGTEVWTETVEVPAALYVPPLAQTHGPVTIRIEFADGTVEEAEQP